MSATPQQRTRPRHKAAPTTPGPARDEELAAFCEREHPRLVGALSLYCGEPQLAEELANDALVKAIDRWPRVAAMQAPGAWVHRVAINLANSRFRRRSAGAGSAGRSSPARRWVARRSAERRATQRLAGEDRPADPAPVEAVAVRRAVAGLPVRQRRCVVLRFYLQHDLAAVAQDLGISTQAASALTYRALQRLRDDLGDNRVAVPDQEHL
jgi:RNA polymerase sigma factor (sigma-70 family)